jgi:hypothetical protein
MAALLPWGIFRNTFLIASIAVADFVGIGRFPLGNPHLVIMQ